MKYVLIVMYLALGGDGKLQQTEFTMEFKDRASCMGALEETEAKVSSRVEARALTLECRPMTIWDDPISWVDYMDDDTRVAAK